MTPRDDELGRRIGKLLEQRVQMLEADTLDRLATARRRALDDGPDTGRMRRSGGALAIAAAHPIRIALMIAALAVGAGAASYFDKIQQLQELEAIDSALLADDLPPNAFIDPGFRKWLERASADSTPQ